MPTSPEIFATTDEIVLEALVCALASDLSEALGKDHLYDYDGRGVIIAERVTDFCLLPEALPRTGSILGVRLCTAYYGKGYERGYWPEIAATLEFLHHRLPLARVWYGPDGTDIVEEVTEPFLDQMWNYWATNGGRPYYKTKNDVA